MHRYHEATKHTVERLNASRHALDWDNMPNPFRNYEGVPVIDLPADPEPPLIPALDVLRGLKGSTEASGLDFLSSLLFYSASISATKRVASTGSRYALRVNPSSGNLHPTEFHIANPSGLYHYRVASHMAEQRGRGDFGFPYELTFILTTIAWREAWKYRDRAYRYCLLDAGHAGESLALCAQALGYDVDVVRDFVDDEISARLSLPPDEWPLLIVGLGARRTATRDGILLGGEPNALSAEVIPYPAIDAVHNESKLWIPPDVSGPARRCPVTDTMAKSSATLADVVRQRRSALNFRGGAESISFEQFGTLLQLATRESNYIRLYAYVHRIRGLAPGVYRHDPATGELHPIKLGDQRVVAAGLSLSQELAGNSCVTFSMIADLDRAAREHGNRGYRYVHFEAGAIGQRLYLAAEALGFQSTGIGAFFDDQVHRYLDLDPAQGQVVYHFACGYGVQDPRL
jgi:SagB-type dehydrogenase family enzyme